MSIRFLNTDELYHYGVLGMKWGVRHDRPSSKSRNKKVKNKKVKNKKNTYQRELGKRLVIMSLIVAGPIIMRSANEALISVGKSALKYALNKKMEEATYGKRIGKNVYGKGTSKRSVRSHPVIDVWPNDGVKNALVPYIGR